MASSAARVLVVGCGGIGGYVAASLAERGCDVTTVTGNERVTEVLSTCGARVREAGKERVVRGIRAWTELPEDERGFDFVLLATQPTQVEKAARAAAPSLAPDGRIVCFQNGLCEARVARAIGSPDRVAGGVVAWGGLQLAPGSYERTSKGGFVLGYEDGRIDAKLQQLGVLLGGIGPVALTSNLRGARWSKLAINCAISSLGTLGGDRLGALLRHVHIRRLALEVMTEAVLVARADGVKLQKVAGTLDLDWIALTEQERRVQASLSLIAKHGLMLAVGARFRRMRSSMLGAIERGRPPAVDYLNGEVVTHGQRLGIATPVNAQIVGLIHRIASGQCRPSMECVRELYAATAEVRSSATIA